MKFSKILTKVIAASATGALLLSAVASASTIKVPNMGGVTREYADMVTKANFFGSLQNLVVDGFTKQCLTESAIDKAITNANLAASTITNIRYLDGSNGVYNGNLYNGVGTHYVRDTGIISTVNGYLANASIGPVTMTFVKDYVSKTGVPEKEYYNGLYLKTSVPLYTSGVSQYLVDFENTSSKRLVSSSNMSTYFSNYANFLSSVKTFYKAAGCYDVTNTTSDTTSRPGNTTNRPGNTTQRPQNVRDAVINVRYTRVKKGTRFVLMDGVTARDNGGRGQDITNKVTIRGAINTAKLGSYRITYSVKGANGKTVSKTVTYRVVNSIYHRGRSYTKL